MSIKYRKLPVVISAKEFTGENEREILSWMSKRSLAFGANVPEPVDSMIIKTLEGDMTASVGDFIIKGVEGEFYPCKPDIFKKTYEKINKNMNTDFKERLLDEARELASKTNKLNTFMSTEVFVDLDRESKDLLYSQSRLMNEYLQILGKRIELLGDKFKF